MNNLFLIKIGRAPLGCLTEVKFMPSTGTDYPCPFWLLDYVEEVSSQAPTRWIAAMLSAMEKLL